MAHHKALNLKGKMVPEWNRSAAQFKAAFASAPTRRTRVRVPPLTIPKDQLFAWPGLKLHHHLLDLSDLLDRLRLTKVRKNQKDLSTTEWINLKAAMEAIAEASAPSPRFDEFVEVHRRAMDTMAGHAWGAHRGINFLSWHREFLAKFEARLQLVNPTVTLPYWDWVNDRAIPPQLADLSAFPSWPLSRGTFRPALLATQPTMNGVMASGVAPPSFDAFRGALESPPHDGVHGAVGGDMGRSVSPKDPLFWLHHAMVDKVWADWQRTNPGAAFNPPNPAEVLQPAPIFTRKVSEVLKTTQLGYVYG